MSGVVCVSPRRPKVVNQLLQALQRVAPLELAGSWDNVGLLLDSETSQRDGNAKEPLRVFLTNDLTEKVAQEAARAQANFIVSYHPTPFKAMRKVDREGKWYCVRTHSPLS
eukprot:gb/GECG01009797.1/.p1 GENE.gb/GECG01009797.1/~~gb/GECG01009797.1/.p1  ORF type:complete len:111 (+),score=8.32 gb/GECG01009797.1/:1-333(+)